MDEVWSDIPDFPDYQISSLGRVLSYRRTRNPTGIILSPNWVGRDQQYAQVQLHSGVGQDAIKKNIYIAKLVAKAFIRGYRDEQLHYFDGDPRNTRADNLWFKRGALAFHYNGVTREEDL